MSQINIAIDGYCSTGKSTLARALAAELGYRYIDTGAMYRGLTLHALRSGKTVQFTSVREWEDLLSGLELDFQFDSQKQDSVLLLNGAPVEHELRQPEVAEAVSTVAAVSAVRRFLVQQQRMLGESKGVVMDGRDIGTVVLPQAELKVFMTADPEVRVQRRYEELQSKSIESSREEVRENLRSRDYQDSHRADSPLRQAADARLLDNTHLDHSEQLDLVLGWARERIAALHYS